jgi:hypothetical protein
VNLVERVPDRVVIVEVEPAGEGDLGTGGEQHLVVGSALGGEEVAAVDHGRGQRAMVDDRSGVWPPGGLVAEELHAVAAFDQSHALGDEAFEFDGSPTSCSFWLRRWPGGAPRVVELPQRPPDASGAAECGCLSYS